MKTNQHGFTILEAVIGMLLASGLAVAIATVVNMSSKAERNASIGAEHAELLGIIRQIIVQPESCTANLKGIDLDVTEPYEPTPVELFFTNTSGTPPVTVKGKPLRTSKPNGNPDEKFFGKIKISEFNASLFTKLSATHWLVKVSVVGEKTGTNVGGKDVFGDVSTQVLVDPDSSEIIKCLGDQNLSVSLTENDIVLNDKICRLGSDGEKVYDPITNTCKDLATCYYTGSPYEASCPPGTVLTHGNYEGHSGDPLAFDRQYVVGPGQPNLTYTVNPQTGQYVNDFTTNTVKCYWATGVVVTSAFRCEACCKPNF